MSTDIKLAFSNLEDRARATAQHSRDRISLRDFVLEVEIGAFQEERGTTQRLRFDVVVEVARADEPVEDDVDRILSYDTITEAIEAALGEERLNLLETLAERIAGLLLLEPRARRVFVRIEKLDRGPFALGVEIERSRQGAPLKLAEEIHHPQPLVLHLSNAAIADPGLPQWLDLLEETGQPVVLTVGMPETVPPAVAHPMPQRRIDLLAIEQNAWVLAARDARCIVVETRTEITHAIHEGQIVVWAPGKMVLDAVDGPSASEVTPLQLARWFAEEMQATELLVEGETAPVAQVPCREVALGERP